MAMTRREAFKTLAKGTLPVLAAGCVSTALPTAARAADDNELESNSKYRKVDEAHALGLLYDATKCVGCKSCMVKCSEYNELKPDTRVDGIHQAPPSLNYFTKNLIKLYRSDDGSDHSYFKQQCMHCIDPGCMNACMFGGLRKDEETGVVWWYGPKCVGCRYCQIACPFHIPAFQWDGFNPKIVKCELCRTPMQKDPSKKEPGCTKVCPTNAVIYGTRKDLLAEAKRRVAAAPGKYYQDKVYGEHDAGGTQVLYLSRVGYDKIGLPDVGEASIPSTLKYSHMAYKWMVLPLLLYGTMVALASKNFAHHSHHLVEEQKETGLRPQL
ncbi:MAG: hydrogenase 2 operon protein HybA [Acidobacteriota bacterium]|nr:hydrogenase 2 operon protein HybA [Acidobacteriota bacterium]